MRGRATQRQRTADKLNLGRLPELIGYMLRRAQMVAFQDFFRAFAAADIRPAQYSVLTVIAHNPGLTQSQVSAALGIKRTNFVALLDSLESRGLAERGRRPRTAARTRCISRQPGAAWCASLMGWSTRWRIACGAHRPGRPRAVA